MYSTILKPGQRTTDKRYKDGVDTGRFSVNTIPFPIKPKLKPTNANNNNTR